MKSIPNTLLILMSLIISGAIFAHGAMPQLSIFHAMVLHPLFFLAAIGLLAAMRRKVKAA